MLFTPIFVLKGNLGQTPRRARGRGQAPPFGSDKGPFELRITECQLVSLYHEPLCEQEITCYDSLWKAFDI